MVGSGKQVPAIKRAQYQHGNVLGFEPLQQTQYVRSAFQTRMETVVRLD